MLRNACYALLLCPGFPALVAAQGFGIPGQGTCAMARAGVMAANPCPDGSAIFFSPAGLAGLSGTRVAAGVTVIQIEGDFTDDILLQRSDLDDPLIPVPSGFVTHAVTPKLTIGAGLYVPYGLETRWPTSGFQGRFLGYNSKIRSLYVQPTVAYQVHPRLKVGIGVAYVHGSVELNQRLDLSEQLVPAQTFTFAALGIPTGTDFGDSRLTADGHGFAVNVGGILKVSDRLSIGGHWLTRKTITYDGEGVFRQIPTNLVLPANNPLGLPGGTSVDGPLVVGPRFGAGQPLDSTKGHKASTRFAFPQQGTIGFAYKVRSNWTVMADYHHVGWGAFNTVTIDFDAADNTTPDFTLTPRNKDTHGFRLATEYEYSSRLILRGGYLYHTAAEPIDFVTPLLPENDRNEVTLGLGYQLMTGLHADLAYQYVRQNDRRGRVFPVTVGNTGLYALHAHLFGVGLAYTLGERR
jgi:long-chain fatty acid transport protein